MVFAESFISDSLFLLIVSVLFIWFYNFKNYWKKSKIPHLQSEFISSKKHLAFRYKSVYDTLRKNGLKYGGIETQLSHLIVISDLEIIKNVMTKDFNFFPHRGFYYNEDDPLSCHIFNIGGQKWKTMRSKLNHVFTPKRLKTFFWFIQNLEKSLLDGINLKTGKISVKNIADTFVCDIIELCVFGLEENKFRNFAQKFFQKSRTRKIKGFIVDNFPNLGRFLNVKLIPEEASNYFIKVVADCVNCKNENFVKILLANNLTIEEISAQCFIFYLAGMSTSPSAITFALYEIAKNQKIQKKLRSEIFDILEQNSSKLTFENINRMPYLDKVFNETLRKYPPAAYLNRQCVKRYNLEKNIFLEKGTTVIIPVYAIHHDPNFYPKPEIFDPERFNKNCRSKFAFLPFGEGPRICIGQRLGELQTKFAMASIIKNFKVGTTLQEPLEMKVEPLVLTPKEEILLDFHKLY